MSVRGANWIFPAVRFLCVLSALFPWSDAPAQTLAAKPLVDLRVNNLRVNDVQVNDPQVNDLRVKDFQETVRRAGLIFEGIVISVQPEWGTGGAQPKIPLAYRVAFQVKRGVRGVPAGTRLVIREWAGLWPARAQHYRVGEHAFLFLYPPSRGGLTSTVGGTKGKLAVRGGRVVLPLDWAQEGVSATAAKSTSTIASTQVRGITVASLMQRIQQTGIVKTDVASGGASTSRSDAKGVK